MTSISIFKLTEDEGTILDITPVRENESWVLAYINWFDGNGHMKLGEIVRVEREHDDDTMEILASYNPRDWAETIWAYDSKTGTQQQYGIRRDAYLCYNDKIARLDDIYNEKSVTYCLDVVDARGNERKLWYAFSVEEVENSEQVDLKFDDEHLVEVF